MPAIRLHDLCHCAATIALASGADIKVVQQMLRHGSVTTTADIYSLVLPELARAAAEGVAQMIPEKRNILGRPSGAHQPAGTVSLIRRSRQT